MDLCLKASLLAGGTAAIVATWKYVCGRTLEDCETETPEKVTPKKCYKAYIRLERSQIGMIIGKKGGNIHRMEMESQCFLKVVYYDPLSAQYVDDRFLRERGLEFEGNDEDSDGENWDEEGVEKVERKIVPYLEVVGTKNETQLNYVKGMVETLLLNCSQKRSEQKIAVPTKAVGFLIGPNGANLKRIQIATHTNVFCEPKAESSGEMQTETEYSVGSDETIFTITGSEKNIEYAMELIERSVSRFMKNEGRDRGEPTRLCDYQEPDIEETLKEMSVIKNKMQEMEEDW